MIKAAPKPIKAPVKTGGATVPIYPTLTGKQSQYIETEVKFEDGRSGKIAADLKIRPVKTFPAITARAA